MYACIALLCLVHIEMDVMPNFGPWVRFLQFPFEDENGYSFDSTMVGNRYLWMPIYRFYDMPMLGRLPVLRRRVRDLSYCGDYNGSSLVAGMVGELMLWDVLVSSLTRSTECEYSILEPFGPRLGYRVKFKVSSTRSNECVKYMSYAFDEYDLKSHRYSFRFIKFFMKVLMKFQVGK